MSGRYYRAELDAIRAAAFFLVFFHRTLPAHSARMQTLKDTLEFGLSLFFRLSAFLICELLLRERETGTIRAREFYIRRILRIWPLYYFGLGLGALIAIPHLAGFGWYAVFGGCWYVLLHGWLPNPAGPLWSISVEEQFYLFAPWVAKAGRTILYWFCFALILNASIWLYFLGEGTGSYSRESANPFVEFDCFAAGILLCLILRGRLPRFSLLIRLFLASAGCLSWGLASYGLHIFSVHPTSAGLILGYALSGIGSMCMILALLGIDRVPKWAVYLGRVSFGLYVYHEFAIYLVKRAVSASVIGGILALGLTILMASVSYKFIETPFLRMKKRHTVIESQPLALETHTLG